MLVSEHPELVTPVYVNLADGRPILTGRELDRLSGPETVEIRTISKQFGTDEIASKDRPLSCDFDQKICDGRCRLWFDCRTNRPFRCEAAKIILLAENT